MVRYTDGWNLFCTSSFATLLIWDFSSLLLAVINRVLNPSFPQSVVLGCGRKLTNAWDRSTFDDELVLNNFLGRVFRVRHASLLLVSSRIGKQLMLHALLTRHPSESKRLSTMVPFDTDGCYVHSEGNSLIYYWLRYGRFHCRSTTKWPYGNPVPKRFHQWGGGEIYWCLRTFYHYFVNF